MFFKNPINYEQDATALFPRTKVPTWNCSEGD